MHYYTVQSCIPDRVRVTATDGQLLQLNLSEWADLCCAVRQLTLAGLDAGDRGSMERT